MLVRIIKWVICVCQGVAKLELAELRSNLKSGISVQTFISGCTIWSMLLQRLYSKNSTKPKFK